MLFVLVVCVPGTCRVGRSRDLDAGRGVRGTSARLAGGTHRSPRSPWNFGEVGPAATSVAVAVAAVPQLRLRCANRRQDASNTVLVRLRDRVCRGRKCGDLALACRCGCVELSSDTIQHRPRR